MIIFSPKLRKAGVLLGCEEAEGVKERRKKFFSYFSYCILGCNMVWKTLYFIAPVISASVGALIQSVG